MPEPMEITLGNRVRIDFEIDVGGTPTDPDTLSLVVKSAREVLGPYALTDPEIVADAVGRFHADVIPTKLGRYSWRYEAFDPAGDAMAASEGEFRIVSVAVAR